MDMDFVLWLMEQMRARGLSQADISRMGGISQGQLSHIINGERYKAAGITNTPDNAGAL